MEKTPVMGRRSSGFVTEKATPLIRKAFVIKKVDGESTKPKRLKEGA